MSLPTKEDLIKCRPTRGDLIVMRLPDSNQALDIVRRFAAFTKGMGVTLMVLPPGTNFRHIPADDLARAGLQRIPGWVPPSASADQQIADKMVSDEQKQQAMQLMAQARRLLEG